MVCEIDADEAIAAVVQENVLLTEDVVLLVVGEGYEFGADEQRAVFADELMGALHAGELAPSTSSFRKSTVSVGASTSSSVTQSTSSVRTTRVA